MEDVVDLDLVLTYWRLVYLSAHALELAPGELCVHLDLLSPCMLRSNFPRDEVSSRIATAWVKGLKLVLVENYGRWNDVQCWESAY